VVQETEHQKRSDQRFLFLAAQSEQNRSIEHADAGRRMACETEQRRGDEYRGQAEEIDIQCGRNQHVHRQRRGAQIENSDPDLQQDHGPGWKPDRPPPGPDASRR
jgi:hypothetical protein